MGACVHAHLYLLNGTSEKKVKN